MKASITRGLESGYYVVHSVYQGGATVRLTVKKRFHEADKGDFFAKWMTRKYLRRNFPNICQTNSI
jgi:hypothetical protein